MTVIDMSNFYTVTISGIGIGDPYDSYSLNKGALDLTYNVTEFLVDNDELLSEGGCSLIGVASARGMKINTVFEFYNENMATTENKIFGVDGFGETVWDLSSDIQIEFDDTVMLTTNDQEDINAHLTFVSADSPDPTSDDDAANHRTTLSKNSQLAINHVPISRVIGTSGGMVGGGSLNTDLTIGVSVDAIRAAITTQWINEKIDAVAGKMVNDSIEKLNHKVMNPPPPPPPEPTPEELWDVVLVGSFDSVVSVSGNTLTVTNNEAVEIFVEKYQCVDDEYEFVPTSLIIDPESTETLQLSHDFRYEVTFGFDIVKIAIISSKTNDPCGS